VRILFVAPYVPSQIRVRPYQFVRELSEQHHVLVLAVGSAQHDGAAISELRDWGVEVEIVPLHAAAALKSSALAAFQGAPLQSAVCQSPELRSCFRTVLSQQAFDVVHIEHLRAARLHEVVPRTIPRVYDSVDCISLLLERTLASSHSLKQRFISAVEVGRTRRFEARLIQGFDATVVTSLDDAHALERLAENAHVDVIPNGVDLESFRPYVGPVDPATLVFSGKMSYHANASAVLHFVKDVLPLVRMTHPEVRLRVVGSNPPRSIKALERDPAISVTGHVADMRETLGGATVAISPMTVKVGIQNKVLEAMALGMPVVTSRLGAQGLDARPEQDMLVAEDSAGFARQIGRLLDDRALRGRLARAGRQYVETYHRWEVAGRRLEAVYERVVAAATASQPVDHRFAHESQSGVSRI
jgi:sugar transferase (PEP-CTERM/EpsH1 system associated)